MNDTLVTILSLDILTAVVLGCLIATGIAATIVVGALLLGRNTRRSQATILALLATEGPSYGLELVDKANGQLRSASVYVHLHDLEQRGLIRSWDEVPDDPELYAARGQIPRRMYAIKDSEK